MADAIVGGYEDAGSRAEATPVRSGRRCAAIGCFLATRVIQHRLEGAAECEPGGVEHARRSRNRSSSRMPRSWQRSSGPRARRSARVVVVLRDVEGVPRREVRMTAVLARRRRRHPMKGAPDRCRVMDAATSHRYVEDAMRSQPWMMLLGLIAASPVAAEVPGLRDYSIDASHSLVGFSIGFLHTAVRGQFDGCRGTILFDPKQPEQGSVTVIIETKSVHTGSDHRDDHLRSEDFFDVDRYPVIRFQSRAVSRQDDHFLMTGPLSLHGVTREASVPFRVVVPPTPDPHGTTTVFFAGELRLARKDFGILGGSKHNDWFDALRSATMADTVAITLEVEGWASDFERQADLRLEQSVRRAVAIGVDSLIRSVRARAAADPSALGRQEWGIDQLARALLVRHREAEGMKLLQLNAELFPNSAAAHTSLARALELSGKRAEAAAAYDRALRIDPDDPRAQEFRRRLTR
jgi:polyisoprenoid-binding protein YceI